MAEQKQGVQGELAGNPISHDVGQKIQDVLKSSLEKELAKKSPTVGTLVGARHGSVTHGSIELAATTRE
jgi:hypothetical protein